jgi:hypothetical protein
MGNSLWVVTGPQHLLAATHEIGDSQLLSRLGIAASLALASYEGAGAPCPNSNASATSRASSSRGA